MIEKDNTDCEAMEIGNSGSLKGENIPKSWFGMFYVADEDGQELTSRRILSRLKVSNRTPNTHLYTVWGTVRTDGCSLDLRHGQAVEGGDPETGPMPKYRHDPQWQDNGSESMK